MGAGYYMSDYGVGEYHGPHSLYGSGSMGWGFYDTQAEFGTGTYSATADYMYAGYGGAGHYSETTLVYSPQSLQIERTSQAEIDAANGGGNTMANYENYLYVQAYDPNNGDIFQHYFSPEDYEASHTLTSLDGLGSLLYVYGQLVDSSTTPSSVVEANDSGFSYTWFDGNDNQIGSGQYISVGDATLGVYVTASYNGVEYGMSTTDAIYASGGDGGGDTGNTGIPLAMFSRKFDYGPLNALLISGENTLSTNLVMVMWIMKPKICTCHLMTLVFFVRNTLFICMMTAVRYTISFLWMAVKIRLY